MAHQILSINTLTGVCSDLYPDGSKVNTLGALYMYACGGLWCFVVRGEAGGGRGLLRVAGNNGLGVVISEVAPSGLNCALTSFINLTKVHTYMH